MVCRCDGQLDPVAKRLRAAEDIRHADYVSEMAQPMPPPPEPALYQLAGARECATAIDGGQVTLVQPRSNPLAHSGPCPPACGPCRLAPPPQCLEIAHDTACKIRSDYVVDPCAHRPRLLIDVSRKTTDRPDEPPKGADRQSGPLPHEPPAPSIGGRKSIFNSGGNNEGLTSRIMKALGGGGTATSEGSRNAEPVPTVAKKSRDCPEEPCAARFPGDKSWCDTCTAAPQPTECRDPSHAERPHQRCRCPPTCGPRAAPPATTRSISPAARRLHTCAGAGAAPPPMDEVVQEAKADAAKLEAALLERAKLKEGGRGRSAVAQECQPRAPRPSPSEGSLELPVPPGASLVRLDITVGAPRPACETPADPKSPGSGRRLGTHRLKKLAKGFSPCVRSLPSSANSKSGAKSCGSLLKTLQKTFTLSTAERLDDGVRKVPKKKDGPAPCKAPCAPKPFTCPPKRKPVCEPSPKNEKFKKANDYLGAAFHNTQDALKKPQHLA